MENVENSSSAPTSAATKYFEKKPTEEAGFIDNAKEYIGSFVHASMDDYKACFKSTWDKVVARFQDEKPAATEGGDIASRN